MEPPQKVSAETAPRTAQSDLPAGWGRRLWGRLKDFSGYAGDATYLLPRWLVLRAVGVLYLLAFAGIITEGQAIIGPQGLIPLSGFFREWSQLHLGTLEGFLRAPSLFWLDSGAAMISALAWAGLAAATALVLNLWPRLTLFLCWVLFLSFVTTWRGFTASQVDQLILETALLCLPFAPAGMRPGLGRTSPPRPITLFMLRWLLFRVMFEAGIVKIFAGDPHWLHFTALDVLYETSPFPTYFGFLDHQLPHAYHVFEVVLTFAAEIAAPLAAVWAGRRGRWFAIGAWTVFQAGIQLTNNFGWLNTASIGLGLILLDDQMIATVAARWKRWRLPAWLAIPPAVPAGPPDAPWIRHGLRAALGLHFVLTLHAFARQCGLPETGFPYALARPLKTLFADFHSANGYTLYAGFLPSRIGVEFEGSNDHGVTWRAFPFRYQPQQENQISPFIAPRYARFEATLQVEANRPEPSPLFGLVAAQLLQRSPEVIALFRDDPFADRPPTMIRVPAYQLKFTDFATYRQTGRYWTKEFAGYYRPILYRDEQGRIAEVTSPLDEIRLRAEHGQAAAQDQLGSAYAAGEGVTTDPVRAAEWFRQAAEQGHADAQFHLGLAYATGAGVTSDRTTAARWFRQAAEQGQPLAQYYLGLSHARGDGVTRSASEAARWYRLAAEQGVAAAQGRLSSMYAAGDGVSPDRTEAAKWLRLAAEGGNAYAQLNLAVNYARGDGVERDEIEALAWFRLAAAAGDPDAVKNQTIAEQRVGTAGRAAADRRVADLRAIIAARTKKP